MRFLWKITKKGERKMARKNRNRSQKYICTGEQFKSNFPIGDCGDTRTLIEWCCYLFRRDEDEMRIFFDDSYTNKDVVDYIYRSGGKRLESVD